MGNDPWAQWNYNGPHYASRELVDTRFSVTPSSSSFTATTFKSTGSPEMQNKREVTPRNNLNASPHTTTMNKVDYDSHHPPQSIQRRRYPEKYDKSVLSNNATTTLALHPSSTLTESGEKDIFIGSREFRDMPKKTVNQSRGNPKKRIVPGPPTQLHSIANVMSTTTPSEMHINKFINEFAQKVPPPLPTSNGGQWYNNYQFSAGGGRYKNNFPSSYLTGHPQQPYNNPKPFAATFAPVIPIVSLQTQQKLNSKNPTTELLTTNATSKLDSELPPLPQLSSSSRPLPIRTQPSIRRKRPENSRPPSEKTPLVISASNNTAQKTEHASTTQNAIVLQQKQNSSRKVTKPRKKQPQQKILSKVTLKSIKTTVVTIPPILSYNGSVPFHKNATKSRRRKPNIGTGRLQSGQKKTSEPVKLVENESGRGFSDPVSSDERRMSGLLYSLMNQSLPPHAKTVNRVSNMNHGITERVKRDKKNSTTRTVVNFERYSNKYSGRPRIRDKNRHPGTQPPVQQHTRYRPGQTTTIKPTLVRRTPLKQHKRQTKPLRTQVQSLSSGRHTPSTNGLKYHGRFWPGRHSHSHG